MMAKHDCHCAPSKHNHQRHKENDKFVMEKKTTI